MRCRQAKLGESFNNHDGTPGTARWAWCGERISESASHSRTASHRLAWLWRGRCDACGPGMAGLVARSRAETSRPADVSILPGASGFPCTRGHGVGVLCGTRRGGAASLRGCRPHGLRGCRATRSGGEGRRGKPRFCAPAEAGLSGLVYCCWYGPVRCFWLHPAGDVVVATVVLTAATAQVDREHLVVAGVVQALNVGQVARPVISR